MHNMCLVYVFTRKVRVRSASVRMCSCFILQKHLRQKLEEVLSAPLYSWSLLNTLFHILLTNPAFTEVRRLQEQLQAKIDLRVALEVGLSMSSGQFLSSHDMDFKSRVELEEIAFAEANVAKLKQKVTELHHKLGALYAATLSDASDRYDATSFFIRFLVIEGGEERLLQ